MAALHVRRWGVSESRSHAAHMMSKPNGTPNVDFRQLHSPFYRGGVLSLRSGGRCAWQPPFFSLMRVGVGRSGSAVGALCWAVLYASATCDWSSWLTHARFKVVSSTTRVCRRISLRSVAQRVGDRDWWRSVQWP